MAASTGKNSDTDNGDGATGSEPHAFQPNSDDRCSVCGGPRLCGDGPGSTCHGYEDNPKFPHNCLVCGFPEAASVHR